MIVSRSKSRFFYYMNDNNVHTTKNWVIGLIAVTLWVLGIIKLIEILNH